MQLADTALAHAIADRLKTLFNFMSISPGFFLRRLVRLAGVLPSRRVCQSTKRPAASDVLSLVDWIHPSLPVFHLIGMAVVTVAMSIAGWWVFNLLTPPQRNPFKSLDFATRPGLATGFKLDRLGASPDYNAQHADHLHFGISAFAICS
jgi:hypothetical protein